MRANAAKAVMWGGERKANVERALLERSIATEKSDVI